MDKNKDEYHEPVIRNHGSITELTQDEGLPPDEWDCFS